jgi:hypothetical protein
MLLYKFRYGTTDLIAEVVKKDRSTIYESLFVLEKQNLIHKFHDSTYRIRGSPAIYCLAAKCIKYLRDNTDLDKTTLRNFYKNKSMRQEHIDHCLNVFKIFNTLKRQVGNKFAIYTKYELNREAFPKPLPELYLERRGSSDKSSYVLDIFAPGTYTWLLIKRLRQHQELSEEHGETYPNILLLAQNPSTEKRLFRQVQSAIQDFEFLITQQDLLLNSNDGKVWIDVDESDEDKFVRVGL